MSDTAKIGVINNFGHSVFNKIDVYIGNGIGKLNLENNSGNYAYKAYLINLLNYGSDSKESWMQSALFSKDDAGQFDNYEINPFETRKIKDTSDQMFEIKVPKNVNSGFLDRRSYFLDSKGIIDIVIPIHADIFHCEKFLKDGIPLYLTFLKNEDSFLLKGDDADDYEVKIIFAELLVNYCEINNEVKEAHIHALEISNLKYPIRPFNILEDTIPQGTSIFTKKAISSSIIPNLVILGLVDEEAFTGVKNKNPFNFTTANLQKIELSINGSILKIEPSFSENQYIMAFEKLMNGLNLSGLRGNNLTRKDFIKGSALYLFDLRPSKCTNGEHNLINTGTFQIQFTFKPATLNSLKLISVMEYENQLQIDKHFNAKLDFKI